MVRVRELPLGDRLAGIFGAGRLLLRQASGSKLTPAQHFAQRVQGRHVLRQVTNKTAQDATSAPHTRKTRPRSTRHRAQQ